MPKIKIDELKPGMILAADIHGPDQRLLLAEKTKIEDRHIRILCIWGIDEVAVETGSRPSPGSGPPEGITPKAMADAGRIQADRFREADLAHDALKEVFRLCVLRTARRLSAGSTLPPDPVLLQDDRCVCPEPSAEPEPSDVSALDLIHEQIELTSLPEVYFKITEVLNSPRSTVAQIADTVGADTALTARLLKLVNSPFYGFSSKIDSIARAVVLVGIDEISILARGICIMPVFRNVPSSLINMKDFWKHAITTGIFARVLAAGIENLSEEQFFVGGLLHDVGTMIMLHQIPHIVTLAHLNAKQRAATVHQTEKRLLGFDHGNVGGMLMKSWGLPDSLTEMIRYHHQPGEAPAPLGASLIHVAEVMATAAGYGFGGTVVIPAIEAGAWERLELPVSALGRVMMQADRQIEEVISAFLGEE